MDKATYFAEVFPTGTLVTVDGLNGVYRVNQRHTVQNDGADVWAHLVAEDEVAKDETQGYCSRIVDAETVSLVNVVPEGLTTVPKATSVSASTTDTDQGDTMMTFDDLRSYVTDIATTLNPEGTTVHELGNMIGFKRPGDQGLSHAYELTSGGRILNAKTREDITDAVLHVAQYL